MMRLFTHLRSRKVPINCRTPSEESTRVTTREKLEWGGYILVLTFLCGGLQLAQFYVTSAVNVNKGVGEELARRRASEKNHSLVGDTTV